MPNIVCVEALKDVELSRKDLERWRRLVHSVGVAFAALTIVTIAMIAKGVDTEKWVSGAAAVASGGGLAWVLTQKATANKTHEANKKAVKPACGAQRELREGLAPADPLPDDVVEFLAN